MRPPPEVTSEQPRLSVIRGRGPASNTSPARRVPPDQTAALASVYLKSRTSIRVAFSLPLLLNLPMQITRQPCFTSSNLLGLLR